MDTGEWISSKLNALLLEEDSRPASHSWLKKVFPYQWAKLESRRIEANFDHEFRREEDDFDELVLEGRTLSEDAKQGSISEVAGLSKEVWESETERMERLEDKAETYIIGIMLTVGVASLVVNLPDSTASPPFIVTVVLGISLVSLLLAALSALNARRATAQQMPTVRHIRRSMEEDMLTEGDQALIRLARAKWNQFPAQRKSRWLQAAESHFHFGVVLLGLGIIGTLFHAPISDSLRFVAEHLSVWET